MAKVRSELATMERAMAAIECRAAVEDGVAWVYRDVQGLGAGEPERALKGHLMQKIFEASLALQKRASEAAHVRQP